MPGHAEGVEDDSEGGREPRKPRPLRGPEEDKDKEKERVRRLVSMSRLNGFTRYMRPDYLRGWLHQGICHEMDEFLGAAARKESPRLTITAPPRHGKTAIVSRCFPACAPGKCPETSIIATSRASGLAARNIRDAQRIIDSDDYRKPFPRTTLSGKNARADATGSWQRNSDKFETAGKKGSYRSAGIGGGVTGMGGERLIIDDPVKNREEADSATRREKAWDWHISALYARLAPGGRDRVDPDALAHGRLGGAAIGA